MAAQLMLALAMAAMVQSIVDGASAWFYEDSIKYNFTNPNPSLDRVYQFTQVTP
jgi:hypothetical protein